MKLAVIGAGEMGHGVAELAALHGHDVRMRDLKTEYVDRGLERIRWSLGKLVEKKQITQARADEALGRIHGTVDLQDACRDADFVIEAVFEDPELKRKVFRELDDAAPAKAILASNTSALPITQMANATKRPQKVVGPYFERAAWIHEREGIPIETIDAAMRFRAGFPMGPFELADQVGVDVLHHLIVNAHRPMPRSVQDLIDGKKLGHKVGEGFYAYQEGRPKLTPDMGQAFDPIRILAPMINEAAELVALDVASPSEIDEAMRLGTAFPKGPLATADDLGIDVVVAALKADKETKPAKVLDEMVTRGDLGVKSGKGFYDHRSGGGTMTYETLLVAHDATTDVATITINRPDRLNTLSPEVFEELDRALSAFGEDDGVRCVIITGAGDRSFSAGADLTSFGDISKAFKVWRFSRRSEEVVSHLANFSKPTIAAINGHCFGGGLEIALACDFRITASRAKLGQTEVNLGLVPGAGGSQRLVRVLGQAKAKELVFLGSRLTADEAATIGLVTKTVPNEAFAAEVRGFAEKLAKQAPIAIRLAKVLLNRSADTPIDVALEMEAMAFGLISSTEDIYEGLQAFMEKREPKFKGE